MFNIYKYFIKNTLVCQEAVHSFMKKRFTYEERSFYLDGEPFIIRSGAIHYFRVPRAYWHDSLLKLKECGFNTVETYLAWNLHEREEGTFDFQGDLDFTEFLREARELGLFAIIRPGPYICAEWEFGGLPYWLLRYPDMQIRCLNDLFLSKLLPYIEKVCERLRPHLIENGGNVLMVQVENEYGCFGNDRAYMKKLFAFYKEKMENVLYFTSDGWGDEDMFDDGTIDGCLSFANFGSAAGRRMSELGEIRPNQPLMCAEFWSGWFDRWHGETHGRTAAEVAQELEPFFQNGHSFNMYMFHGGTNFGFMNGSILLNGEYQPTVTSYDYGAPLNEAGDRTETYYAVRALFEKYVGKLPKLTAKDGERAAYGELRFTQKAELFKNIPRLTKNTVKAPNPIFMEDLGQGYGYVLYRSEEFSVKVDKELTFLDLKDRAVVYVNGKKFGVQERGRALPKLCIKGNPRAPSVRLDLLVENMGRNNFGPYMFEKKGLGCVLKAEKNVFGWESVALDLENTETLEFENGVTPSEMPAFYKAKFTVDEPKDTFLKTTGFTKGFAMVNGFNLGRYYNTAGPQQTLYVPATALKKGENELIVFESDEMIAPTAEFVAMPQRSN